MRIQFLTMALLLLPASTLAALDRIDPVPADKPVPAEVKAAFDQLFRADVAKVSATPDPAAAGELAVRIYSEAGKRKDNPDFVAYALDQVVYFASVSPGRQDLAYLALRVQKESSMRPLRGCLEKMILVAPRFAEELGAEARSDWVKNTWMKDAALLADLQIQTADYEQALKTLTAVAEEAKKLELDLPDEVVKNIEGLVFIQTLKTATQNYKDQVKQPGNHPQAFFAVAILSLMLENSLQECIKYLTDSADPAAADLALALTKGHTGIPQTSGGVLAELAVIRAEANLADKVEGAFFQLLLCKEAKARLVALRGLTNTQRLTVVMLTDRIVAKSKEALSKLPPMVQKQFEEPQVSGKNAADSSVSFPMPAKKDIPKAE